MADIKLKDLRYLVAVADTRHFGRAAASCFVSQPTLSAQLRKLEEYLGVQLIERQPRHAALTQAGEAVVAGQQLLVVEAMKMQNELRAPRDGVVSRVAVAPGETIEIGDLLLVLE